MRTKITTKSEKSRPAKDKKPRRSSNLSSAKACFSGNSQANRKKLPKLLGSSSSNAIGNSKLLNTNSSKLKTGVSTDISDCNDTQEKSLFISSLENLNKKEISTFNLQKANQNMEIFMPSEPESTNSGFSSRKKLKTSLINSPNFSEKKQDNSANRLSNLSLKNLNVENFPNKNLNEIYLNNITDNLNNLNHLSHTNNFNNNDLNNFNNENYLGGLNNNYITKVNEKGFCALSANSEDFKQNTVKNSYLEDYLINLGFSSGINININNHFENNSRSKSKENGLKKSNKENSSEFKSNNQQQQQNRNLNLNSLNSKNVSLDNKNNSNSNICNNNLLLIKNSDSNVNNHTTISNEYNININNKSSKINIDNNNNNINNNNINSVNLDSNKSLFPNNNNNNSPTCEESEFEILHSDNHKLNLNYETNKNENMILNELEFASGERIKEEAPECLNFDKANNKMFNNFYEIEEENSEAGKLNDNFDHNKNYIPILVEDREDEQEEVNTFMPNFNSDIKFDFQYQENRESGSKFKFKSSIFSNSEKKAKANNMNNNNVNNHQETNKNLMVIEEYQEQDSNQKNNGLIQNEEGEGQNGNHQINQNQIPFIESFNHQSELNQKISAENMYFNFENVNSINYEHVFNENIYSNVDYSKIFDNANSQFLIECQTQVPIGMRITNIIRPHKKSESELDYEFDENRHLHERGVNTFNRRNRDYMEKQAFIRPKMRKILLDWINEISSQLRFKRSTFHLTIALLDCFLSKLENLEVDKLQLTGVTCLLIAAKYEEILIPNVQELANATNSACTHRDIVHQETLILKTLNWQIDLTSFSTWINETTLSWDDFLSNINFFGSELMLNLNMLRSTRFRENSIQSLNLFRALTQYIDIISFDVEYLWYVERILCLGVLYLLILKYFGLIDFSQLSYITIEHVNHLYEFNLLFDRFLNRYYSLEFVNIFDHIQYASCYIATNLHFDQIDLAEITHWEETLQIQTYNPHNFNNDREATRRKNELRRDTNAINSNDYPESDQDEQIEK